MYNLDNYINFLKEKLDKKFFSPLLSKLANLYFLNEDYDTCIKYCNILIEVHPYYLTPYLLKAKALIKQEYYSEAENELKKIEIYIPNKEVLDKYFLSLKELKSKNGQAKIFYKEMISDLEKFEDYLNIFSTLPRFDDSAEEQELLLIDKDLFKSKSLEDKLNNFKTKLKNISLTDFKYKNNIESDKSEKKEIGFTASSSLGNIKIITESIADVFVKQGLYSEAFDAYTLLLRAGHKNKKTILEKIHDLERRM